MPEKKETIEDILDRVNANMEDSQFSFVVNEGKRMLEGLTYVREGHNKFKDMLNDLEVDADNKRDMAIIEASLHAGMSVVMSMVANRAAHSMLGLMTDGNKENWKVKDLEEAMRIITVVASIGYTLHGITMLHDVIMERADDAIEGYTYMFKFLSDDELNEVSTNNIIKDIQAIEDKEGSMFNNYQANAILKVEEYKKQKE